MKGGATVYKSIFIDERPDIVEYPQCKAFNSGNSRFFVNNPDLTFLTFLYKI